ncbi:MAG: cytochrome c [Epsilonproteobacteria bacterium]|nr:cytochrome c [Campylobacterota bacterium]
MKKIIFSLVFFCASLLALDGQKVFESNCAACHLGEVTKAEFMKQIKTVKAPPMIEVSNRLKNTIQINPHNENSEEIHRFAVISYIKEYVKHPSFDYYMCDDAAVSRFDVMPAQKNLKEDELQAVAEWIYDYFEGKEFK